MSHPGGDRTPIPADCAPAFDLRTCGLAWALSVRLSLSAGSALSVELPGHACPGKEMNPHLLLSTLVFGFGFGLRSAATVPPSGRLSSPREGGDVPVPAGVIVTRSACDASFVPALLPYRACEEDFVPGTVVPACANACAVFQFSSSLPSFADSIVDCGLVLENSLEGER